MSKYIDAEQAIEVCDWYEHEYIECEDYIRTIADDIRHLPAADVVEVRHGRWENDGHTLACSNCHNINIRGIEWNYCPNCGARMDGEQE